MVVLGLCCCRASLSLVAISRATLSLWRAGFSLWWSLLLWNTGSRAHKLGNCSSWTLEHWLSSCGTWISLLLGMWDLSRSGIEPVSPALDDRVFTPEPPGNKFFELGI